MTSKTLSSLLIVFGTTILPLILSDSAPQEQQSESSSETETDSKIQTPAKDNHGIWILNDDEFDPFLDSHEDVAVLFTTPDDLYSYAGKYHFDRAAHILRDLRNSTTEFAVSTGNSDSFIHEDFGIEYYPT
eukprot:141566_1